MGSSPNKLLTTLGDPVGTIIAKNASPGLAQIAAPLALVQKNAQEGKPTTIRSINDPGNLFTKSQAQKDKIAADAAYAADAPRRAAEEATTAANTALRAKNLRRRASSLLSSGSAGAAAPLATPYATGLSTFGG